MKCSKCGFINNRSGKSCIRCGNVFTGIHKDHPQNPYFDPDLAARKKQQERRSVSNPAKPKNAAESFFVHQTRPEFIQQHTADGNYSSPLKKANGHNSPTATMSLSSPNDNTRKFVISATLLGIFAIGCLMFYATTSSEASSSSESEQFAKAEDLYLQNSFEPALTLYRKFQKDFPKSLLLPLANDRIQFLNDSLLSIRQTREDLAKQRIHLLKQARILATNKQYLSPSGNNAIAYLNRLQKLDPDNAEEKALRTNILANYQKNARSAYERRDYPKARELYSAMIKISPTNIEFHRQLQNLEELISESSISRSTKKRRTVQRSTKPSNVASNTVTKKASDRRSQKNQSVSSRVKKSSTASQTILNATTASTSSTPKTAQVKKLTDRPNHNLHPTPPIQLAMWNFIRKDLSLEVKVISETSRDLVLFHSASRQKIMLSLYRNPEADIYAVRKRKRGGNPYRVWYAASNLAKKSSAEAVNMSLFFSKRFKERIIIE